MDAESNATYLTLAGHVELHKYRYLYFGIMFTAYILIICCNSIIIGLVRVNPNLHEPMYIFIAALSVNSLLFSTAIYPKLLIDLLSERQLISYSVCLFQAFVFYSLGSSDFLLLAAMSYDHYVSICKPLQYPNIMGQTTVVLLLCVAWLMPAVQVQGAVAMSVNKKLCQSSFNGIFCNNSFIKLQCVISKSLPIYALVIFLDLCILPVIFILLSYIKIFMIAHRSSGEVKKKATETCLPHLLVLINFLCLSAYDVIIARLESHIPRVVHLTMTIQFILYNPLLNPIIYGLKMKEISKHLRKLFCEKRLN